MQSDRVVIRTGALIVAAGKSSRMGDFKPLLKVGNMTMIMRVINRMKMVKAHPIVVVTGFKSQLIEEHLKDEDIIMVYNEKYETTQMLDSLVLGMEKLQGKCEQVLFSPSDVAVTNMDTVQKIMDANGLFVRPMYQNEPGHPVRFSMDLYEKIKAYQGHGGLKACIESNGIAITELEVEDIGIVMDSDTHEDYVKVNKYWAELIDKKGNDS